MSVDYFTYLGAFAKIESLKVEKTEHYNGCGNADCKVFGQPATGSFCSSCGSPICVMEDTYFDEYTYSQWAFDTNNEDKMFSMIVCRDNRKENYLFPNYSNIIAQTAIVASWDDNVQIVDCSTINPVEMQKAFMSLHDHILTPLRAAGFQINLIFGFFKGAQC